MEMLRVTRLDSSMPPVTTCERRRSSPAPALSLGGRRIDRSTRANSFEVTVALWPASTGSSEMADLRGTWASSDSSVCRPSPQLTGRFSRHRLFGVLLHKIFSSHPNLWVWLWRAFRDTKFGKKALRRVSLHYFSSITTFKSQLFTVAEHSPQFGFKI